MEEMKEEGEGEEEERGGGEGNYEGWVIDDKV